MKGGMMMLQVDPDLNRKFLDFFRAVFGDGALDRKTKELIGLSVSLAVGCRPCFELHTNKARRAGATDQEIREAVAVAEVIASGRVRSVVAESTVKPQSELNSEVETE